MKLIVGLGNPTREYEDTLHNIGFRVIQRLAEKLQPTKKTNQFYSLFYKGKYNSLDYALLLPQTYMNLSGKAVVACTNFYKVALTEVLVVCDSLDLPVGTIRYKTKGGHGGHNGLRDIIQKLATTEFSRLAIGIGRPAEKTQVSSYVLQKISTSLQKKLQNPVEQATELCIKFLLSTITSTTIT